MLIVTSSNGRLRYIRCIVTRSGISARHGPHQVAHTFTSRYLPSGPSLAASFFTPAASIVLSETSSASHFARDFFASSVLSDHFVEQPKTLVFSTDGALPARSASIALRVSWL